jgi:hypothetical protein
MDESDVVEGRGEDAALGTGKNATIAQNIDVVDKRAVSRQRRQLDVHRLGRRRVWAAAPRNPTVRVIVHGSRSTQTECTGFVQTQNRA